MPAGAFWGEGYLDDIELLDSRLHASGTEVANDGLPHTGGRHQFGIGPGWYVLDFEDTGTHISERGKRTDERLDAVRLLLTTPNASFEGQFYNFTDVSIEPLRLKVFFSQSDATATAPPAQAADVESAASMRSNPGTWMSTRRPKRTDGIVPSLRKS